jgi:hypothetical protein
MHFHITTSAGLANRLRALDSTLVLARYFNAKVSVSWPVNKDLCAHFNDLFEPSQDFCFKSRIIESFKYITGKELSLRFSRGIILTSTDIRNSPIEYTNHIGYKILSSLPLELIPLNCKKVNISTEHAFCYPENYRYLHPKKQIMREIHEVTQAFKPDTIGIHIRRCDNNTAISSSPTEVFVSTIRRIVAEQPTRTFFLATDDIALRSFLIRSFPNSIITRDSPTNRDSISGMRSAVVDLWCLACCHDIWGSIGSSFSELAYHINAKNLFYITRSGLTLASSKGTHRA